MEIDPHGSPSDRPLPRVIQQSGVVAFRWTGSQPEFCLITSRRSKRWGFPKGGIGRSSTTQEAALQEAFDEAGLSGVIVGEPLSQYVFKKRDKKHEVLVYLMQVQSCANEWKESRERSRQWVSLETAHGLIDRPRLAQLLLTAAARILTHYPNSQPALFPNLQLEASQTISHPIRRN